MHIVVYFFKVWWNMCTGPPTGSPSFNVNQCNKDLYNSGEHVLVTTTWQLYIVAQVSDCGDNLIWPRHTSSSTKIVLLVITTYVLGQNNQSLINEFISHKTWTIDLRLLVVNFSLQRRQHLTTLSITCPMQNIFLLGLSRNTPCVVWKTLQFLSALGWVYVHLVMSAGSLPPT